MQTAFKDSKPALSSEILFAFQNPKITKLVERTLAEDLTTFGVKKPNELAILTMTNLIEAGNSYPEAATYLALEVYPTWQGEAVRKLYHDYNWDVERKGSAEVASPHIKGKTLIWPMFRKQKKCWDLFRLFP